MNQESTQVDTKKIVLAVTGASGAIYAKLLIEHLQAAQNVNLFITASSNGLRIFRDEMGVDLREFTDKVYPTANFDVPYVSGSAKMSAMIIAPCSMGTLGRIAGGISDDAITRAADVFLKERRQLILMPRETPLNAIQLKNMLELTQAGATILPAMPHFYSHPQTPTDIAMTVVNRIFDHLNLPLAVTPRWHDTQSK